MSDRIDLELRVYLTGRPDGTLEWQVFAVDPDGQLAWQDGDIDRWRPNRPLVPVLLRNVIEQAVSRLVYRLRA